MPFKPGQSGNPTGAKPWRDAIAVALKRQSDDGKPWLAKIADKLVRAAADGDMTAIKELGDRLDGKAVQQLDAQVSGQLQMTMTKEQRDAAVRAAKSADA